MFSLGSYPKPSPAPSGPSSYRDERMQGQECQYPRRENIKPLVSKKHGKTKAGNQKTKVSRREKALRSSLEDINNDNKQRQ